MAAKKSATLRRPGERASEAAMRLAAPAMKRKTTSTLFVREFPQDSLRRAASASGARHMGLREYIVALINLHEELIDAVTSDTFSTADAAAALDRYNLGPVRV